MKMYIVYIYIWIKWMRWNLSEKLNKSERGCENKKKFEREYGSELEWERVCKMTGRRREVWESVENVDNGKRERCERIWGGGKEMRLRNM